VEETVRITLIGHMACAFFKIVTKKLLDFDFLICYCSRELGKLYVKLFVISSFTNRLSHHGISLPLGR
jgi:hypothetical protein